MRQYEEGFEEAADGSWKQAKELWFEDGKLISREEFEDIKYKELMNYLDAAPEES